MNPKHFKEMTDRYRTIKMSEFTNSLITSIYRKHHITKRQAQNCLKRCFMSNNVMNQIMEQADYIINNTQEPIK